MPSLSLSAKSLNPGHASILSQMLSLSLSPDASSPKQASISSQTPSLSVSGTASSPLHWSTALHTVSLSVSVQAAIASAELGALYARGVPCASLAATTTLLIPKSYPV